MVGILIFRFVPPERSDSGGKFVHRETTN